MLAFEKEIAIACDVAKRAAALALKLQKEGLRAETKSDASPVTAADRESERLICAALDDAFPDDGLLGEEGARKESKSGRRWILDPIDGTRDFVRGTPLWCVMIALEDHREVEAGVIHFPLLGWTCWGSRGGGAFRNDVALHVSDIADPAQAVLSVNSINRVRETPLARGLLEWSSRFWAYRCLGGTPDAMMVAAGEIDVWIEPKVAEWDLAAPQVILEEAGAKVFDFYGRRTIYSGNMAACAPGLEAELRAFLGAST